MCSKKARSSGPSMSQKPKLSSHTAAMLSIFPFGRWMQPSPGSGRETKFAPRRRPRAPYARQRRR
jgi:hypothetical protein